MVTIELQKEIRMLAARDDKTMLAVVAEAIDLYKEKRNKKKE